MKIRQVRFAGACVTVAECPTPDQAEFALIGRSNVGKSSLVNKLTGHGGISKVSSKPGKTRTINHFAINEKWYLVDLPGYGYAKAAAQTKLTFQAATGEYLLHRPNLELVFLLLDCRLEPQPIDLEFIEWLLDKEIPFDLIFTKADKISRARLDERSAEWVDVLAERGLELRRPPIASSAVKGFGIGEILQRIDVALRDL